MTTTIIIFVLPVISHLNFCSRLSVFIIFPMVPLLLYSDTSMICLRKQDLNTVYDRHADVEERNLKRPHHYPKDYNQLMTAERWRICGPRDGPSHYVMIFWWLYLVSSLCRQAWLLWVKVYISHVVSKRQNSTVFFSILQLPQSFHPFFHNALGALEGSWYMQMTHLGWALRATDSQYFDPCLLLHEWNKYEKILTVFWK